MKKFFTVLFFIFFTFLFTLLFLLGELKFYVLTPAFIKDPLRENNIYEKAVTKSELIQKELMGKYYEQSQANMPESARMFTQVILKSVDPVWFQTEFEKAIDALYRYMTSDEQTVKIKVDLRGFKSELRKNVMVWMREEYKKFPEVPVEEFDRQVSASPEEAFPKVRPQGMTLEQTLARMRKNPADILMARIPDTYDANFTDKNKPEQMEGLAGFKNIGKGLYILTIAFYVVLLITILFLLLAAKLTSKTWRDFLWKLGIYLSAALVPLVVFQITRLVAIDIAMVEAFSRVKVPVLVREEFLQPVVESVIDRVVLHLTVLSGIFSAAGVAIIAGTQIKKRISP